MKKILNFAKKKKHPPSSPDNRSGLSVGYEFKEKDLGKVHKAALVGDLSKLKQLAKKNDVNQLDKENRTALHIACASGHVEVVQFLVESKAKLNLCDNQNRSALMKAVQGQHERCVSILLENRADPNHVDINGNTALHLAANIPSISTTVLLLEHAADINAQNKEGFTPLTVSVREDHFEMAEFLLNKGAGVNVMDQAQRSPLMHAARNGHSGMLQLLLRFEADITLKDNKGWSADEYAVMNGHHPCSLLIIEHGTQMNDGPSLSNQGPGKKKKKPTLGSPSQDAEARFSLGGPASDKDEHGTNEAGGDFEDNSQSESLSRVSKNAADEWPSSEDDGSVLIEKNPQKVNLRKMIASKRGEDSQEKDTHVEQPSSSKARSDCQEGSPEAEDSEEEVEEEEEGEEEEEEEEEGEEEEEEEEEEDEEEEEEEEDDDEEDEEEGEDEEEESEEQDEEEITKENECDEKDNDKYVASVEAVANEFKEIQKTSVPAALKTVDSADAQNTPGSDVPHSHGTSPAVVSEDLDAETEAKVCPAGTASYAMPATLDVEEDCVVSAIRVESKFSDEEDSHGKECPCVSAGGHTISKHHVQTCSPPAVEEEEFETEFGIDADDSWNSGDEEENQTGALGCNTVLANLRNVGPEDGVESTEGSSNAGSNRDAFKGDIRRSSWGSSLDDSDLPKEEVVNTLHQKRDAGSSHLKPEGATMQSKSSIPRSNKDHLDTSWDSSFPVVPSPNCVSPHTVKGEPVPSLGLCSTSTPLSNNRPAKATVDESEWDSSSENNDPNDNGSFTKGDLLSSLSKTNIATVNQTGQLQCADGSYEEANKENVENESNGRSHVVSPVAEDEKNTRGQTQDNDDEGSNRRSSQTDGKLFSEKEEAHDESWDEKDVSDESGTSRPRSAINCESEEEEDSEAPPSMEDGDDEYPKGDGLEEERLAGVEKDNETSEDSDSLDQKLQYDFASATVKVADDDDEENEARLTAYVPLENRSAVDPQPRVSSDDLDEEAAWGNASSSPATKGGFTASQLYASDGSACSDEAVPRTDIDDVDVDSPDEAESIGTRSQKNEYSSEDEGDGDQGEEDVSDKNDEHGESRDFLPTTALVTEKDISKDKRRDFLSELGLEKEEEEQDSWDSESHSENPNMPRARKQSMHTQDQEQMPTVKAKSKEIEINDGSNGGQHVEEDVTTQKETEKTKWETLRVLNKLEGDGEQKTDLMEELGLGNVDDFEDASDWDSASTASRRTLPGSREQFPECIYPSVKEQDEEAVPAAPLTPERSINSHKTMPTTPQQPGPQPQPLPRARKMVLQKAESEGESDLEQDNVESTCNSDKIQLQNIAELQTGVPPGFPQRPPMVKDSKKVELQKVAKEKAAASEVNKSTTSCDTGGMALEEAAPEKPESRSGSLSSRAGATHQEEQSAKSTNGAPVLMHSPPQQTYNSSRQEGEAVEETLQPQLVRGASRAPLTSAHDNGDPLSVFDDSTLSELSDDEGRDPKAGKPNTENPEEVDMAEDFDELTQSSDTATDDVDSPTSGYRHASVLIQTLDSATLDSRSMVKLQNIFHEYERCIQKARSRHGYLSDKVSQLEMERAELKRSLEEVKDVKSALERNQLELQTEVTNLKFQLKQEVENRRNATMMYNTTKDKLRRMEEQQQLEVQERQKVELSLRNLQLEMRTLVNNMKQLEEDHSETQRLLAHERSARTLQENLLSSHLRKQQEIEEDNKRNISKSNEALSQLTEASDRERELMQQSVTLQDQLTTLRSDHERLRANSSLKESHLSDENEALKEQLEDVRRDLKLNSEALTQTVFNCNNQVTTLKSELAMATSRLEIERQTRETLDSEVESARIRLAGAVKQAELSMAAHTDLERVLLREKEEHQRFKDRITGEAASQREAITSLSQKLARAESGANSMENEVHRATLQLTEKSLLLEVLQREKDQGAARIKELESALQSEREQIGRVGARQEAAQERLAQTQSEGMLLRQQLEEAQNKGVAKERAVTDAQERFSDILAQLRSDSEERVQLVEERSKELASKAADLRDQIYRLEEEKNERETSLRQLQQELADSLKKLSMSEASLEVNTRYRNDLEEEKARLFKDLDRVKGKLEESEDQYVQAEKRINCLKNVLDEKEKELAAAAQRHQAALSASAASEITIKQLEEAMQQLEIENARLEAAAKQQSNKIETLQKGAQESAMLSDCAPGGGVCIVDVRGHLEDLVSNLQSNKMNLEDQLTREVQKRGTLSHTAQDSQALWEEELKSRSKLGLRLAELEKEKGDLSTQMEIEKKKAKKIAEQKKAVDIRLDQEMNRNTDLQKEMYRFRTLLKTAKKKLRDQETGGAEYGSPISGLQTDQGRQGQAEGAFGLMKERLDDLQLQLKKEGSRRSQLEKANSDLTDQLASLKSLSCSNDQLERSRRQLEEEVLDLRRRMEASQMDQSQVERVRQDAEERARQEINQKLEQVNIFLQSQAASQEALDQIKATNEANLRSQLEQKIRELEGELGRARTTHHDSLSQRDSTRAEVERLRHLYAEELRLRKSLVAKLERANRRLAEANSKLLITSSLANGSLGGPSLDVGSLGSPAHYGATLGPLNRSLGLGRSLLSPVTDGQSSRVEDYLAKMQSELDKNISKELNNAAAELDVSAARLSPVGSSSRGELDPASRATQQYLEVLKKNRMI
ncbi:ankyrin repeat domain-containing protein 26 isoform X14 [Gasterosteus aculeatus]